MALISHKMSELCQGFCKWTWPLSAALGAGARLGWHRSQSAGAFHCLPLLQPYQRLLFIPSQLFVSSVPQPPFPMSWGGSLAWCKLWGSMVHGWRSWGQALSPTRSLKGGGAAPESIKSLSFLQALFSFYFEGLWVSFSTTFCQPR